VPDLSRFYCAAFAMFTPAATFALVCGSGLSDPANRREDGAVGNVRSMPPLTNIENINPGTLPRRHGPMGAPSLTSDILPLLDALYILVAAALTAFAYMRWTTMGTTVGGGVGFERMALLAAVVAPFILYEPRFGSAASRGSVRLLVGSHLLRFALFTVAVLALGQLSYILIGVPRSVVVLWLGSSLALTSLSRVLMARYVRLLQRRGALTEVIAVVGAGPVADRLVLAMRQTRPDSVALLGVFDDASPVAGSMPRTGTIDDLLELGKTRHIDWILLTAPPTAEDDVLSLVNRLKALSVPIGLCPQHIGAAVPLRRVDCVANAVPVSILVDRPITGRGALQKTCADLILGSLITLLLAPLLLAIAVAIKLTSPGPVFFRQRRHALDNREFEILKFRTMRWVPPQTADALIQTTRFDKRVTPLGRILRAASLDELPQLLNVLSGEMSLVGPRPHAVNMRTESSLGVEITQAYPHRHRVKPGMTGWSQVNGARGATETRAQLLRRVELDLHYIDNWSLLLDFKILALTTREVLKRTNAY